MLQTLASLFYLVPQRAQQPFSRWWYERIAAFDRDADMTFMNYGWADPDLQAPALDLHPDDEPNRYCIQLYHRVAGAADLRGLNVLEVGSGRGGGAAYIARYLQPRAMTGLDLTNASIRFCRAHYAAVPGLSFVQGSAEALEFAPETFDAVVNVESSHCYDSMPKFLGGVRRVLKPGGHFLFADHRDKERVDALRRQFREAGLHVVAEETINDGVVRALELDNARKQALINRKVPRPLRYIFNEFAGMQGTRSIHATLRRGDKVYLRLVARRAEAVP